MKKVKRSRIKTVDETEKIILPQILCSSPSIVGEPLRIIKLLRTGRRRSDCSYGAGAVDLSLSAEVADEIT